MSDKTSKTDATWMTDPERVTFVEGATLAETYWLCADERFVDELRAYRDALLVDATHPGREGCPDEVERFQLLSALHAHFTGVEVEKMPVVTPKKVTRTSKKKTGKA